MLSPSPRFTGEFTDFGREFIMTSTFTGEHIENIYVMLFHRHPGYSRELVPNTELPSDALDPDIGATFPTGYDRVQYASPNGWSTGIPGTLYNTNPINFPVALIDWPPVVAWGMTLADLNESSDTTGAAIIAVGTVDITVKKGEHLIIPEYGMGFTMAET